MSTHEDPVEEVDRALMQLPYLLAQGVETLARVRTMRVERREHADRAEAETDLRAAAEQGRWLQAERDRAQPTWDRANDRGWLRSAPADDLVAAWSTATAWQERDRGAGAAAQRTEAEMRRRWPEQVRGYDDARAAGLPAHKAMRTVVSAVPVDGRSVTDPALAGEAADAEHAAEAAGAQVDDPSTVADEHRDGQRDAAVLDRRADDLAVAAQTGPQGSAAPRPAPSPAMRATRYLPAASQSAGQAAAGTRPARRVARPVAVTARRRRR